MQSNFTPRGRFFGTCLSYFRRKEKSCLNFVIETAPGKIEKQKNKTALGYCGQSTTIRTDKCVIKQLYNTKVIALFRLLPENVDEFTSKLLDEEEEFCYIPIFTFCKSTEIHQLLTQLPTEKIVKLRNALGERYKRTNLNISADYPILKEIGEKILADFPESSNQSLKGHLLRVLGESLIKEEPAQT